MSKFHQNYLSNLSQYWVLGKWHTFCTLYYLLFRYLQSRWLLLYSKANWSTADKITSHICNRLAASKCWKQEVRTSTDDDDSDGGSVRNHTFLHRLQLSTKPSFGVTGFTCSPLAATPSESTGTASPITRKPEESATYRNTSWYPSGLVQLRRRRFRTQCLHETEIKVNKSE